MYIKPLAYHQCIIHRRRKRGKGGGRIALAQLDLVRPRATNGVRRSPRSPTPPSNVSLKQRTASTRLACVCMRRPVYLTGRTRAEQKHCKTDMNRRMTPYRPLLRCSSWCHWQRKSRGVFARPAVSCSRSRRSSSGRRSGIGRGRYNANSRACCGSSTKRNRCCRCHTHKYNPDRYTHEKKTCMSTYCLLE